MESVRKSVGKLTVTEN